MRKLLKFFQQNISVYAISNDQSFNDTLTNNVVSFKQLSSDVFCCCCCFWCVFACVCVCLVFHLFSFPIENCSLLNGYHLPMQIKYD